MPRRVAWAWMLILAPALRAEERKDQFGDPLPQGAIARLGTLRLRTSGATYGVAVSPDGKRLACLASEAETSFRGVGWSDAARQSPSFITVWDVETGREIYRLGAVSRAATPRFSRDGRRLAAVDGRVRVWDVETAREMPLKVPALRVGQREPNRTLALSRDGGLAAFILPSEKVMIWNVDRDEPVRELDPPQGLTGYSGQLLFSPDDRLLVLSDEAAGLQVWKVASGEVVHRDRGRPRKLHGVGAVQPLFSRDGRMLVTVGADLVARVWDPATWEELRTLEREPQPTYLVGLLADDRTLLISNTLEGLAAWDLTTGKKVRDVVRGRFTGGITADGKTLVRNAGQGSELLDAATGEPRRGFTGPMRPVEGIAFHLDGKRVALATDKVRVFELETGRELAFAGPTDRVGAVAFSPDGRTLLAATPGASLQMKDGRSTFVPAIPSLHLLDADSGKSVRGFEGEAGDVEWVQFLPDGKTVLSFARQRRAGNSQIRETSVHVWDVPTGKEIRQISLSKTGQVSLVWADRIARAKTGQVVSEMADRVALSADGRRLAHGMNWVFVGDLPTGPLFARMASELSMIFSLAVAPTGRLVASGVYDQIAKRRGLVVWELATGKPLFRQPFDNNTALAVAFSPDERFLATGLVDGTVRLWDVETGREVKSLRGHRGFIAAVAFSPDGKRLVSGGGDAQALVWDVGDLKGPTTTVRAGELDALWSDLASANPQVSEPALRRLARSPAEALPRLREQMTKGATVDPKVIARLVEDLDARDFKARGHAEQELAKLGEIARDALNQASMAPRSAEQRKRVEALLARLDGQQIPTPVLRLIRCVAVLEQIGTAPARALLESLTRDGTDPRVIAEARAALQRKK